MQTGSTSYWSRYGNNNKTVVIAQINGAVTNSHVENAEHYGVTMTTSSAGIQQMVVNQRFADRTRPGNIGMPVALYLGNPAQI